MDRRRTKKGEGFPGLQQPDTDRRLSRKRPLSQPCCPGRRSSKLFQDTQTSWSLNPISFCSSAKIQVSLQESCKPSNSRDPDIDPLASSSSTVSSQASDGARCCALDSPRRAEASHSERPVSVSDRSSYILHEYFPPQSLVDMFNKSCHLQYEQTPLKIIRASYQYMYDDANLEYIDCVNSVAHVGHCHPAVVEALSYAMSSLVMTCGELNIERGDIHYPSRLQQTLPPSLDTFLFCNSGSEAVDLSLQLARLYTCGTDAIVVDNAFHGNIDSVYPLSPKVSKEKSDWVHVVPMPDLYRGQYQADDPQAVDKYLADARDLIERAKQNGKKIACFIAEPMLTIPGCIIPPSTWLQEMYKMVRESHGLCIADEVQTGLGRVGSHFWSFQAHDVVPDILVIGKPLGNGYPMAAVVTSRDIAAVLGNRIKDYWCTTAMDAVGCAVLDVIQREQLMNSAAGVGSFLKEQLLILKKKHEYIGDVRGKGLLFGIEIVWSKRSKKPAREIAEQIVYRMKEENILIANEGDNRNILMMMPPMCFSQENAKVLSQKLDKVLTELPAQNAVKDLVLDLPTLSTRPGVGTREVRLGIFQPQEEEDEDNISSTRDTLDIEYAQHCYQDLD